MTSEKKKKKTNVLRYKNYNISKHEKSNKRVKKIWSSTKHEIRI